MSKSSLALHPQYSILLFRLNSCPSDSELPDYTAGSDTDKLAVSTANLK